jgi:hypothetical protein
LGGWRYQCGKPYASFYNAWMFSKALWCRRMDSVENQVEQLGRSLADMRGVEGLREETLKERFLAMEKTLRDVNRGVQLIRDKQVGLFFTSFH